jgi:hypothetical protein
MPPANHSLKLRKRSSRLSLRLKKRRNRLPLLLQMWVLGMMILLLQVAGKARRVRRVVLLVLVGPSLPPS